MNIYTIFDKKSSVEKGIILDKINDNEIVYFSLSSNCMVHMNNKMFIENYNKKIVSKDKIYSYLSLITKNLDNYRLSNFTESYTYLVTFINKLKNIHLSNKIVVTKQKTECPICLETININSDMVSFHNNYDGHVCCPTCYNGHIYITCPLCRVPCS